jgi:hypothetical protein
VTASPIGNRWLLPVDIATRFDPGLRVRDDTRDRLIAETIALRRCALHRKAFRGAATSYPADALQLEAVAEWIRRIGATVDVVSSEELGGALSARIPARRLVMHCADGMARAIRRAVSVEVGRFVVSSRQQISILAEHSQQIQRVLVDVTAQSAGALAPAVLAHDQLDLIGLHCRVHETDDLSMADSVRRMIGQMSRIGHEHGVVLSRVSLGDFDTTPWCRRRGDLRRLADGIDSAIGDGCAQCRHLRPALTFSPRRASLFSM